MTELSSLSNIRHENLVKLNGGCIEGVGEFLTWRTLSVQKAWEMHKDNRLLDLVDSTLEHDGNFSEKEARHFLKVGLLCVQEKCNLRPKMSAALQMMMIDQNDQNNVNDFNNMEIRQPGVIANNMDLKIGQRENERSSKLTISRMQSPQVYHFNTGV
ncbi:hypothetical protein M0R45_037077 [Rubus argutus]|uniref:Uncharacterized protein n=1 Tax=Rubus argutus TaxID=59490 RepID=A0AAW1W3D9_RUBAR